jgi:hypothetical protein
MDDLIPSFFCDGFRNGRIRNIEIALRDGNVATREAVAQLFAELKHHKTVYGAYIFLLNVEGSLEYLDDLAKRMIDGRNSGLFSPAPQLSSSPHRTELDKEVFWKNLIGFTIYDSTPTDRKESTPTDRGEFIKVLLADICRFIQLMKEQEVRLLAHLPIPLGGITDEIIVACKSLKSCRVGLVEEPVGWLSCWRLATTLFEQLPQNFGLGYYLSKIFQGTVHPGSLQSQSIALASSVRIEPLCQWLFGLFGEWDRGNVEARLRKEAVLLAQRFAKADQKFAFAAPPVTSSALPPENGQSPDADCANLEVKPAKRSTERGEGREKPIAPLTDSGQPGKASLALMRIFTNGLTEDRIARAIRLLENHQLRTNEKLTEIDALIPFPPTASAEQLGNMLGVTKQAVLKTDWWIKNRKGEKDDEIGRRRKGHRSRALRYEAPGQNDEND